MRNLSVAFLDALERVAATVIQQIIVLVLGAAALDVTFWQAVVVVVLVGVANVALIVSTTWVPNIRSWWLDTVYRVVRSVVVSAAGQLVAVQAFDDLSVSFLEGVAIAAGVAGLTVVKAAIAFRRPPGVTPASLITASGELAA